MKIMLLALSMFLLSCGSKVKPLGFDNKIKDYVNSFDKDSIHFKMNIFEEAELNWDEMAIINPYIPSDSIDNLKYSNLWINSSDIKKVLYRDDLVTIILSHNKKIVSIDTISRHPIDFKKLLLPSSPNSIRILSRSQVKNLIYVRVKKQYDNNVFYSYTPILSE